MLVLFRCFNDVKMAVWISFATGMTTGLDLEILMENSGLVSEVIILTLCRSNGSGNIAVDLRLSILTILCASRASVVSSATLINHCK